jgi:hypothetical protein
VFYYARAFLWHMFGTVLFPDATGDMASWMYIPCLMDWNEAGSFSWGSAVLSYLYCQLREGCRRRAPSSNLGGCTYLLHVISISNCYLPFKGFFKIVMLYVTCFHVSLVGLDVDTAPDW